MNPYIRYGCGAQAAAVKITNSENMHVIPFMRCGSRRAYGSTAGFFLHHGVMHAAAIGPPQWRIGMVCTPADFCRCCWFCWTGANNYRSFQEPATMGKDSYEKLNSSCRRLCRHLCSDLGFRVLCNQKRCFLLDLLLYFFFFFRPVGEV